MNELKMLELFAEIYGAIGVPIECAEEFVGIKKMLVKVGKIDNDTKPPTMETYNIVYYVKDVKLETEAAYMNIGSSNPEATTAIKMVSEAKVIE